MQVEYKQRFSVTNVLSRAFNTSAVEQNLDLNYMPTCSLRQKNLPFWGGTWCRQ